jgi:hypothetical protein
VLTAATVLVVQLPFRHATAWHWFDQAAHLLIGQGPGPHGLHLYAGHPEFQFGPLSIVAAVPLAVTGALAAMATLSFVGVWCAVALTRLVGRLCPSADQRATWVSTTAGGVLLILVWGDVAVRTTHLDDGIALAATVAALAAAARGRGGLAAVAFGVAGAAKPWAVAFAPILLALDDDRRWRHLALAFGIVALTWAPFLLAEPETLRIGGHTITNESSSALRALGVDTPATPGWVRPTQLVGGVLVAAGLAIRGRWAGAVMAAVAVRLLFDPAANRYYTVGLVLGLLLHELFTRPERLPWMAACAAVLLEVPQNPAFPPSVAGWLRVLVVVGVFVAAARAPLSPALPAREPVFSGLSTLAPHGGSLARRAALHRR